MCDGRLMIKLPRLREHASSLRGKVPRTGNGLLRTEINMRLNYGACAVVTLLAAALVIGCSTAPKTEGDAEALSANAYSTLTGYKAKDPSLGSLIDKSAGYAVFPDIGKGGWIVGGSYGRGQVYEG